MGRLQSPDIGKVRVSLSIQEIQKLSDEGWEIALHGIIILLM
jgi:hypothetical protein